MIPGCERSPGEGNGNPLQYSCLENLMDRGAWRAAFHGVTRVGHDLATKPSPSGSLLGGQLGENTVHVMGMKPWWVSGSGKMGENDWRQIHSVRIERFSWSSFSLA